MDVTQTGAAQDSSRTAPSRLPSPHSPADIKHAVEKPPSNDTFAAILRDMQADRNPTAPQEPSYYLDEPDALAQTSYPPYKLSAPSPTSTPTPTVNHSDTKKIPTVRQT